MALIKCIDCGKEYSPRAHACPNCGCPTWDNVNELYKQKQALNIDGEVYDISEIISNIQNGVDDQTTVELFSKITGYSCNEIAYVFIEIKKGNFSPWCKDEYGYLINQKLEEQKKRTTEQPSQNIPHCPSCGSTNIEKISFTRKAIGFLAVGILSPNARSTFKCKSCGYKW